jgi:2'-5' RNA ligase
MEPVRAFIAIELPESIRSSLSQLQDQLKQREYAPVKWVDPDSIHLTLKFLGNIDAGRIPALTNAIYGASRGITPFRLMLGAPGVFPHFRAPRVIWIGLTGDTHSLSSLQENIERALVPLGFSPEGRHFSPHLTLGRVRDSATHDERQRLGEAVPSLKAKTMSFFEVNSISLMRSTLTREGALYSCLDAVALGDG